MEHALVAACGSSEGCKEAEMPEGSDSGVEVNGGAMGGPGGDVTPAASCDSSLVSCCYSSEDLVSNTLQLPDDISLSGGGDGTSEGGSESSSIAGYHKPRITTSEGVRKRCPSGRTPSTSRPSPSPSLSSRSRTPLSSRERTPSGKTSSNKTTPKSIHPSRAISTPNASTPRSHRDNSESSASRKNLNRVPSVKVKTNSPPTDCNDGRWPSTLTKLAQKFRPSAVSSDKKNNVMNTSVSSVESKATALEKYATLPRRRRKSADNLTLSEPLSSREPSLNRSASLRKKQSPMVSSATSATLQVGTNNKTMPPYPRKNKMKTRIYHEISIQTVLTGADLENGLGSSLLKDVHSRVGTKNCGVQVERGMRRIEQLETQLKECKNQLSRLAEEREELSKTCDQLRIQQLTRDAEAIRLKSLIIGNYDADDMVGQLEQQVLSMNSLVNQQQQEITQLHGICHRLQRVSANFISC